jgi:hypothetical protein|nr:MAG TPA: hypothetical protein [Caudoviricetes sp.]
MIDESVLYGPNRYLKEAIAKETGFMSSLISLARDIRGGWLRYLDVAGASLTRAAGCELKLLPELVDGFAREVKTIGKDKLYSYSGHYASRNGMFRAYPSQNERTSDCYYRLYHKANWVSSTYDLEEVRDFLTYGTMDFESEHATKGNNETDDYLQ